MSYSRRDILRFGAGLGTAALTGRAGDTEAAQQQSKAGNSAASPLQAQPGLPAPPPAQDSKTGRDLAVGPDGDFKDIAAALAAVTDASAERPYRISVAPGSYGAFDMKEYVDVIGASRGSTVIELAGEKIVNVASYCTLSRMSIRYRGADGGAKRAALERNGPITEFVASDLDIDVTELAGSGGPRHAIGFFTGNHTATFYNVKIRSESSGIFLPTGQFRFHGCDCYLAGTAVGLPHVGLEVHGAARVDWYGGRIGTGYYYDQELDDPLQDVLCVYIPQDNAAAARVELHDAEMFARNIIAEPGVRVNAVRAENGWLRLFGCFCQSEPGERNDSRSLFAAWATPSQSLEGLGGKIELFGSRVTGFEGNVFGSASTLGMTTLRAEHSPWSLSKFEGGLILCDASGGDLSVSLPGGPMPNGDAYVFKRVDGTQNQVTIDGRGRLIDGAPSVALDGRYAVLRVVAGPDDWFVA